MARYTGPKSKIARSSVSLFTDRIRHWNGEIIRQDSTVWLVAEEKSLNMVFS